MGRSAKAYWPTTCERTVIAFNDKVLDEILSGRLEVLIAALQASRLDGITDINDTFQDIFDAAATTTSTECSEMCRPSNSRPTRPACWWRGAGQPSTSSPSSPRRLWNPSRRMRSKAANSTQSTTKRPFAQVANTSGNTRLAEEATFEPAPEPAY